MPTVQEVDQFDIPDMLIPRISKVHGYTTEMAAGLVKEAKRLLYLDSLAGPVSPSTHVDMAWHEMLLFTKWYQAYCEFLGKFVHHDPTPGPPDGGRMYAKTKDLYKDYFGQDPNPKYWP